MKAVGEFELLGLILSSLIKVSSGLDGCGRELLSNTTSTAELQSDVMLPCYFNPVLCRPDEAKDILVVWSKIKAAALNLLEFKIHSNSGHWVSKDRRIRAFPRHSSSGNFSIILHKAQLSDEGLYRCELFKGINCSVAYEELNLKWFQQEDREFSLALTVHGSSNKASLQQQGHAITSAWSFKQPCVIMCRSEPLARIDKATELQSDVLLPCYFTPAILGSDKSADIAAVWSQRDITVDNLVEIKLQGDVMFWRNRGGRIKAFSNLSESGNFSILLHNIQQSDLGLYRCELSRGNSCTLAFQDIYLGTEHSSIKYWHFLLGAAVALCLLLAFLCFMLRRRRSTEAPLYANTDFQSKRDTKEETVYENDMEIRKMKSTSRGRCQDPTQENSIYVNCERKKELNVKKL